MIYLGADHAGFELKEELKKHLLEQGKEVEDLGAFELNEEDDYPDFIIPVAKKVAESPEENRGIVFGGSGQGEAIAANKVKGIRAAVYYGPASADPPAGRAGASAGKGSLEIVRLSRAHNDSNILSLGARFLIKEQALEAVDLWLKTPFEGGHHERRIQKIE